MKKFYSIAILIILGFSLNAQIPTENIVFYAPFTNGDTSSRAVASEIDIATNVTFGADRSANANSALNLNGNTVLRFDNSNALSMHTRDFSVSTWVKSSSSSRQIVMRLGKFSNSGSSKGWVNIELNHPSGQGVYANVTGSNNVSETVSSTPSISNNAWHHVVFVRRSDLLYLYVDNVLVGSNTSAVTTNVNGLTFRKLTLGANSSSTTVFSSHLTGSIDDFAIFNKALTSKEVNALFNQPTAFPIVKPSTELIGKFDFNNSVVDSLQNATSLTNSSVAILDRNGNANSARGYNGTQFSRYALTNNQYNSTNVLGNAFSASLWFKSSNSTQRQILFSIGDSTDFNKSRITLEIHSNAGDSIRLTKTDANATVLMNVNTSTAISDNNWHQLVIIKQNDLNLLFLDGNEIGRATLTTTVETPADFLTIGAATYVSNKQFNFVGDIDEVYFYKRAINKDEIKSLLTNSGFNYKADLSSNLLFDVDFETDSLDKTGNAVLNASMSTSVISGVAANSKALDFFANNSFLEYNHNRNLILGSKSFSISFWMKTSSTRARQTILSIGKFLGGSAGNERLQIELKPPTNEDISIVTSNGANATSRIKFNSTANLYDNNWHHVVFTRNSNGSMVVTIDGIEESRIGASNRDILNTSFQKLLLGAYNNPRGNFYTGGLDDVKIYDKFLNSKEIQSLYNLRNLTVNINEASDKDLDIAVYPNPFIRQITFKAKSKIESIKVYDKKGSLVLEKFTNDHTYIMNLESLRDGMYIVKLISKDQVVTKKILKQ